MKDEWSTNISGYGHNRVNPDSPDHKMIKQRVIVSTVMSPRRSEPLLVVPIGQLSSSWCILVCEFALMLLAFAMADFLGINIHLGCLS